MHGDKRRQDLVNAVAARYGVLLAPELLERLLHQVRDPLEAVGEALEGLPERPLVLSEVRR